MCARGKREEVERLWRESEKRPSSLLGGGVGSWQEGSEMVVKREKGGR